MFDLTPEEARLLLNVALMAVGANRFRSAEKLLSTLAEFRPGAPQIAAARAVMLIGAGRFEECVDYADREGLPRFPGDPMLNAFKGMALLRLDRRAEARAVLAPVAAQTADAAAAQLAKGLLQND